MQNETGLYEVPADRLLYTHEGLGAARDLGEAQIVRTFWGGAKVHVVHDKEGSSGWFWALAILAVLGAIAALWFLLAKAHSPEGGGAQMQPSETPAQTMEQPAPATPPTPVTGAGNSGAPTAVQNMPGLPAPAQPAPEAKNPSPQPTPQAPARVRPEKPAAEQPAARETGAGETGAGQPAAGKTESGPRRRARPQAESSAPAEHAAEAKHADDAPTIVQVPQKPAAPQPTLQITNTTDSAAKPAQDGTNIPLVPPPGPRPEGTGTQP